MNKRLAIVTTHPIQYNAPLFKLLTERNIVDIKVFYTFSQSQAGSLFDAGFAKIIEWDIPLLNGYEYLFINNTAKKPGTWHFRGIKNPTLISSIEEWGPDAVLVYGWSFKSHLQCIRYFKNKIPVLFRGDSNLIDKKSGFTKSIRNLLLKWVYRNVDHALYVGTANKLYYLKNGLKENQLTFAPHAIDNDRFCSNEQLFKRKALQRRLELGITEKDIVFLFAGKLEPKKNPELLIKAFQHLEGKAHLIIVGNGVLEKKIQGKTQSANIHFLAFQNQLEMPIIYRMGDVFVLPSSGPGETWGLAVNEAMASSSPVIVSDKCGSAFDLVQNGKNGYVFRSTDIEDLSKKMKLMLDKNIVRVMGERSKQIIKYWSFEIICIEIEKIMQGLKGVHIRINNQN